MWVCPLHLLFALLAPSNFSLTCSGVAARIEDSGPLRSRWLLLRTEVAVQRRGRHIDALRYC